MFIVWAMLSRYTEKNKYGGHTWHIKLDSLFHVFIHETEDRSYVIDFKEWKWLSYKTHFSFVSNKGMEETIVDTFEKTFVFFDNSSDYLWTESQKNKKLNEVLDLLKRTRQ